MVRFVMTGTAVVGIPILIIWALWFWWDTVRPWWRDRQTNREWRQQAAEWQARQPPIVEPTPEQLARLRDALPGLALPALVLTEDVGAAITPGGTRIGGPVWLADGVEWPVGKDGRPLEFIAQLDFAAMPPLPDYPEAGLLQLFIGRDDEYGLDFEHPDQGNFLLLWHSDGPAAQPDGGRMVPPPRLPQYGSPDDDGYSATPFMRDSVREQGFGLVARAESRLPGAYSWPQEQLMQNLDIDSRAQSASVEVYAVIKGNNSVHHIGGHPAFTQNDYRLDGAFPPHDNPQPSPYRDHDRVLFQLTSENGLQWGDMGEASVMIRREDLLARRFERAVWWWDCF